MVVVRKKQGDWQTAGVVEMGRKRKIGGRRADEIEGREEMERNKKDLKRRKRTRAS